MNKVRVLFVCVHNSARSQMAEAFLNNLPGERFEARSAGLEPGQLNPYAVRVMEEAGIDISRNMTKDVFALYRKGELFNYVIAVCDEANAERCPIFPGHARRLNWSFADPSAVAGTDEEKLQGARRIRDQIRERIEQWAGEI
ncbi:MAG: arsenate reductase ArsC [Geobacteraceae bacterium]|nr:arsenate reductase ArsC [Geobacteraceae bacterium]